MGGLVDWVDGWLLAEARKRALSRRFVGMGILWMGVLVSYK